MVINVNASVKGIVHAKKVVVEIIAHVFVGVLGT